MPAGRRSAFALLRSTPFRLALTFAILLIVAFLLTGLAIYLQMRADLTRNLDQALRSTYAVLSASYQDGDLEGLVAAVDSHSRLAIGAGQLFSLTNPNGTLAAGRALPKPAVDGAYEMMIAAPDGEKSAYRALTGKVAGKRLTVAFDASNIEELLDVVLVGFGWASFAVAALAVGGGALLASRAQRRLDAIAGTMNAVSHGELNARIPLIGSGDDIDQMSASINGALVRLNDMVDGVRQVSNDIAHELKTPLNRLQLMVESALARPERSKPALLDALTEIVQLNATFEAMLRIAQIESGVGRSRFEEVDLALLLADLVEIYAGVATDNGRSLSYTRAGSAPKVSGDRGLLTQLFANLIENALRHTPVGTRVAVSIGHQGADIVTTVDDDGPGIPAGERGNVLRRLYRLDNSRSTQGTGLGLSIVAAITELHSAKLSLDDNAPGLRVTVLFSNAS